MAPVRSVSRGEWHGVDAGKSGAGRIVRGLDGITTSAGEPDRDRVLWAGELLDREPVGIRQRKC